MICRRRDIADASDEQRGSRQGESSAALSAEIESVEDTMGRWLCAAFVIGCVSHLLIGCAASPRQRPVGMGAVATGPNTLEAVRKQLEGRWVLTSFNVTGSDGQQAAVDATGMLTCDAFGVLHVEYRISDTGQQSLATLGVPRLDPVLSTTGRVVINPQQKQITYVGDDFEKRALGFDPALAASRANPFALERTRYYELGADGSLLLSSRYDDGRDASVSRWKKSS
jgi:hypothetical protein